MRLDVRTVKRDGEEVLDCPLCRGRSFTQGSDLRAHLERYHRTSVQWRHAENQTDTGKAEKAPSPEESPETPATA